MREKNITDSFSVNLLGVIWEDRFDPHNILTAEETSNSTRNMECSRKQPSQSVKTFTCFGFLKNIE